MIPYFLNYHVPLFIDELLLCDSLLWDIWKVITL